MEIKTPTYLKTRKSWEVNQKQKYDQWLQLSPYHTWRGRGKKTRNKQKKEIINYIRAEIDEVKHRMKGPAKQELGSLRSGWDRYTSNLMGQEKNHKSPTPAIREVTGLCIL